VSYEFDVKDIRAMKAEGTLGDFIRANAGLTQRGRTKEEQFSCPHCKAGPGQRCVIPGTGHILPRMHSSRAELLKPIPPEPIPPVGHWPVIPEAGDVT